MKKTRLAEIRELLTQAYSSGETITGWCVENNITKDTFYRWKKILDRSGEGMPEMYKRKKQPDPHTSSAASAREQADYSFVQLQEPSRALSDSPDTGGVKGPGIAIRSGQFYILLADGFSEESLGKVIRVMSHVQ